MTSRIQADHHATTPMHPEVRRAMVRAMDGSVGNPSSVHREGVHARTLLEDARREVAALVGARGDEIVFTSGGTESIDLALGGMVGPGEHLVTTRVEHPAVTDWADRHQAGGERATRHRFAPAGRR